MVYKASMSLATRWSSINKTDSIYKIRSTHCTASIIYTQEQYCALVVIFIIFTALITTCSSSFSLGKRIAIVVYY